MTKTTIHRIELAILFVVILITFIVLEEYEIAEWFYQFSRKHEKYELDELILTVAFSFLYLAVFTLRRYYDLKATHLRAITDPLVQALNRRGGVEIMEKAIAKTKTTQAQHCLILFDIDNFKRINDKFGHETGDIVLKAVARITATQLRSSDKLIRWGGEEFLVFCQNTKLEEGANLAERIRATLESTDIELASTVTASFGVALLEPSTPLRQSIKLADTRQYLSKENGKNQVTWQRIKSSN